MDEDRSPFLPLSSPYLDDKDANLHAYLSYKQSRAETSSTTKRNSKRRSCLLLCAITALTCLSAVTYVQLAPNSSVSSLFKNNSAQTVLDAHSTFLLDQQNVKNTTLPHTYNGTFPSAKLNKTLGFEKIYVINMEKRQDKRDEMTLLSYAANLNVEFFQGVNGNDLAHQTIAYHKDKESAGVLGCYRSHVNVLRKIVEENVESALILEDDPDWDVDLRTSMERLQDPFATLIGSMKQDGRKRGPTSELPWGNTTDWDQLYLGACLESAWIKRTSDGEKRFNLVDGKTLDFAHAPYVLYEDDVAPAWNGMNDDVRKLYADYGLKPSDPANGKGTRIVQKARAPICTVAYAVTRRGAARLLYELTRGMINAVDLQMAWAAEDGRVETYTVYPPLVSQWKITGGGVLNTDVNDPNLNKVPLTTRSTPDVGTSGSIKNSIRSNFKKSIRPARAV